MANVRDARAEADRILHDDSLLMDFRLVLEFLRSLSGDLMMYSDLRKKGVEIALKASDLALKAGAFSECIGLVSAGRPLTLTAREAIDLELPALEAFTSSGQRDLALEKLKILSKRKAEMTHAQKVGLSRLQEYVLRGK